MIITKTPLRISFFGGGTDYPVWYEKNGGSVISTTINKYSYISTRYLPPFFEHKYQILCRLREEVKNVSDIKHPSVRECLNFLNGDKGIEMAYMADLPAMSGIGFPIRILKGFFTIRSLLPGFAAISSLATIQSFFRFRWGKMIVCFPILRLPI